MKRLLALLLSMALVLCLLAGCGGETTPDSGAGANEGTSGGETAPAPASDIFIGFSTGAAGTTFRQEGIDDFSLIAEEYKAEGRIKGYKIVNNVTNWDANEQANIIRDFINDNEVNVIVVNPNSPTDLNGVLAEAVAAGKIVVAVDCEVDVEGVICVSIDHYEWGKRVAEYVCSNLGSGNIIQIYGGDGHPANNERIRATYEVLENYPDIKLVADTTGGWDNQVAKQVTSQILGGGQQIDGYITQDAMGYGVLTAFTDLGKVPQVIFLECGTASVKAYEELKDSGADITMCSQPNPPSIVASGLRVAVALAEGREFKDGVLGGLYGRAAIYDVKSWYTDDNFEEMYDLLIHEGDDYLLTEYWSESEAQALFK